MSVEDVQRYDSRLIFREVFCVSGAMRMQLSGERGEASKTGTFILRRKML